MNIKFDKDFKLSIFVDGERKKSTVVAFDKTLRKHVEDIINQKDGDTLHFIVKTAKLLKDGELKSEQYVDDGKIKYRCSHEFEKSVVNYILFYNNKKDYEIKTVLSYDIDDDVVTLLKGDTYLKKTLI